jgi:hypothetical protein
VKGVNRDQMDARQGFSVNASKGLAVDGEGFLGRQTRLCQLFA